jgi:hypothetical protein
MRAPETWVRKPMASELTREEIKSEARKIYALASGCRVPMLRACKRIKMATSTPHRWLHEGAKPADGHMEFLRAAILRIAAERNTLPDEHRAEFETLGGELAPLASRHMNEIVRDIEMSLEELKTISATLG